MANFTQKSKNNQDQDIPLDVQQALVNPNKLRSFKEKKFKNR